MRVIAFTGMPGSGKSEAVAVARARGLPVVRMGDLVWDETRQRGLPLVDANVGRVATEMRQTHGPDYWAAQTCEAILRLHPQAPLVVIDGVRNHEEVETFRRRLAEHFELVAIEASEAARRKRLQARGRSDDPKALEELAERDRRELGWGIDRSIANADHRIRNEGDLESFRRAVGQLLDQLRA